MNWLAHCTQECSVQTIDYKTISLVRNSRRKNIQQTSFDMLELSVITVLMMFPDVSCNPEKAGGLCDNLVVPQRSDLEQVMIDGEGSNNVALDGGDNIPPVTVGGCRQSSHLNV